MATQSSVSAITAGLQAIGSRSTAKPSARADEEGVEAVEVVEAALERLLERVALAQPPGQVAGRDLGVVVGLEHDALAPQLLAQAVVVRERAVVHQAQVEPGRERVRVLGRDPLSVAIRVWPSAWLPCSSSSRKRSANTSGRPISLKISIALPALITRSSGWCAASQAIASSAGAGTSTTPWLARTSTRRRHRRRRRARGAARASRTARGGVQREPGRAGRGGLAVERDAGAVGTAIAELLEHRRQVRAEPLRDGRCLGEQSYDSAHGRSPRSSSAGGGRLRRTRPGFNCGEYCVPHRNIVLHVATRSLSWTHAHGSLLLALARDIGRRRAGVGRAVRDGRVRGASALLSARTGKVERTPTRASSGVNGGAGRRPRGLVRRRLDRRASRGSAAPCQRGASRSRSRAGGSAAGAPARGVAGRGARRCRGTTVYAGGSVRGRGVRRDDGAGALGDARAGRRRAGRGRGRREPGRRSTSAASFRAVAGRRTAAAGRARPVARVRLLGWRPPALGCGGSDVCGRRARARRVAALRRGQHGFEDGRRVSVGRRFAELDAGTGALAAWVPANGHGVGDVETILIAGGAV